MAEEKRDATPEERAKIVKCIKEGRVKLSSQGKRYFERAGVIKSGDDADFTVVDVEPKFWGAWEKDGRGNKGGMEIAWTTVSAGFGSLTIYIDNDGKLRADTEGMSKKFCKEVLVKLIDSLENDEV